MKGNIKMKKLFKLATLILVVAMLAGLLVPVASARWDGNNDDGWQWLEVGEHEREYPATGWRQIGGAWYWFGTDGIMARNEWRTIGGIQYRFGWTGALVTGTAERGWQNVGGQWFWLDQAGRTVANTWLDWNGNWYRLGGDGAMLANTWWSPNAAQGQGPWYRFNHNGEMVTGWFNLAGDWFFTLPEGRVQTGWIQVGDNWYFMSRTGAYMLRGWHVIDGRLHQFANDGVWLADIGLPPGGIDVDLTPSTGESLRPTNNIGPWTNTQQTPGVQPWG